MATINSLPFEVIIMLMQQFEAQDCENVDPAIFMAAQVCKAWRDGAFEVLFKTTIPQGLNGVQYELLNQACIMLRMECNKARAEAVRRLETQKNIRGRWQRAVKPAIKDNE